jgi:hypothetical protein
MKSVTLEHSDGDRKIVVCVSTSTGITEMRRHRIRFEQSKIEEPDRDRWLLRTGLYPDLIAAAKITIDDKPVELAFDDFAELDGAFSTRWESAVFELNPHWAGVEEKKATA